MLIETLVFLRVYVLFYEYPNIEQGSGGSLAKGKTICFER